MSVYQIAEADTDKPDEQPSIIQFVKQRQRQINQGVIRGCIRDMLLPGNSFKVRIADFNCKARSKVFLLA